MPAPRDVTTLLIDAETGDCDAYEELVLRVYDELRALAQRYLHHERLDHTLEPTALVHEAYMRLVDQKQAQWKNQAQFFRVAANTMRRVLVDHARKHLSQKRGGHAGKLSLTLAEGICFSPETDLLAIDEALEEFAAFDPYKSKIVEMRFFAGLSMDKIAKILDVSTRTVERDWSLAKAWLYKRLAEGQSNGPCSMEKD
ncbi:MAG: sigma-70 family RNA polymerase sigma factor [Planctomycetota bacterium]